MAMGGHLTISGGLFKELTSMSTQHACFDVSWFLLLPLLFYDFLKNIFERVCV